MTGRSNGNSSTVGGVYPSRGNHKHLVYVNDVGNERPASRKHVQALESQVSSLEAFIQKLASSDDATRARLLAGISSPISPQQQGSQTGPSPNGDAGDAGASSASAGPSESGSLVLARAREGKMCKLSARKATQFYGGTSLFQMSMSESSLPNRRQAGPPGSSLSTDIRDAEQSMKATAAEPAPFPFKPKDDTCRQLMATFFQHVYQYNMCIYREYFLRDYDAGGGPYYSDALLFSVCAVGALISADPSLRSLSPTFAHYANSLVFNSLEQPDLTTLQALLVLGHTEISQGRSSKGWLLCGMAFRLTHEMGLHLDPTNWSSNKSESTIDREILRRVYWAVFIADKQLSLYFGRPPALYPHEADVRNTIRIAYPPEWESLIDTYLMKGTSATAFEDGLCVVGALVHRIELSKIFHTLIVDVFENRLRQSDETAAAATAQQVHTSLVRWLALLPQKLHWNQWTVGQFPPYVLHLHMLFHTGMIILHRPPRQHLDDEAVIKGEGIEVCYQSLAAILRLLKSYSRYYRFQTLPLDFVHTLAAAAEVVMLKRYMEKSSWDDKDISKPTAQILEAMESVQDVHPCIREIRDSILASREAETASNNNNNNNTQEHEAAGPFELDLMDLLQTGADPFPSWYPDDGQNMNHADLGFLVTEDSLNQPYTWESNMM